MLPRCLLFTLMILPFAGWAQASPREELRVALSEVKQSLERPDPQREILPVLQKHIDFREMGLRALGRYRAQYERRADEFIPLFVKFLNQVFLDEIIANKDFQVVYLEETFHSGNDSADVPTRVFLKQGKEEYRVLFTMHQVDGRWRIVDVTAEGVSVLSFYSSQFQRVIKNRSFDELLRRLDRSPGDH